MTNVQHFIRPPPLRYSPSPIVGSRRRATASHNGKESRNSYVFPPSCMWPHVSTHTTHKPDRKQGNNAQKQHNAGRAPTSSVPMTGSPLHWSAYRGDLGITWILLKVRAAQKMFSFLFSESSTKNSGSDSRWGDHCETGGIAHQHSFGLGNLGAGGVSIVAVGKYSDDKYNIYNERGGSLGRSYSRR